MTPATRRSAPFLLIALTLACAPTAPSLPPPAAALALENVRMTANTDNGYTVYEPSFVLRETTGLEDVFLERVELMVNGARHALTFTANDCLGPTRVPAGAAWDWQTTPLDCRDAYELLPISFSVSVGYRDAAGRRANVRATWGAP